MVDYAVEIGYPPEIPKERFGVSTIIDVSAPCADIAEEKVKEALAEKMYVHHGFKFDKGAYKTIQVRVINAENIMI